MVKQQRRSAEAVQKLWERYHETGDSKLRDQLALSLAPMVKYIVYRKVREIPARCEVEDFISCGLEALLRSIDRYDPSKGATLEQFAWTRIHGAVLVELRRNDWAPRSLRRSEREISRARERFIALHGRAATREELADMLGLSADGLDRQLSDIGRADLTSLNATIAGEDETTIERIDTIVSDDPACDPEARAVNDLAKERLLRMFSLLSERERKVALLLYVHNLTLREIGEIVGVTESRVCQIHTELRNKLRDMLSSDSELFESVAC